MKYNIYCDESSHLAHSENKIMTMGMISCPKEYCKAIGKDLRMLKSKHRLSVSYELKWTKVSLTQIDYYKEVIDYYFEKDYLSCRVIIADKSELDYPKYRISHDDWYYRMYYLLLGKTLIETNQYNIYIDIKDTCSNQKIKRLHEILSRSYYDFAGLMILKIQQIRSHESELLQMIDLIIGAVAYKNNELAGSAAKLELCRYLEEKAGKGLTKSTGRCEEKFNILKWRAGYYG